MLNIGVLVSGGGTNLQALIDSIDSGAILNANIVTVVSSKADVYALERAKEHNISAAVIPRKAFSDIAAYDEALVSHMQENKVDLIVMAGFLSIVGEKLVKAYAHKIINVHPSLIPSFCGSGYYGLKVHEKVLSYGVKVTGATVHFVDEVPDGGPIILQKAVDVYEDDTPEKLQKRVMEQAEWVILPQAVELFCSGELVVEGRKVKIKGGN